MNAPVKSLSPADASKGHNRPPVLTPDELKRDFSYLDHPLADIKSKVDDIGTVCEDEDDLEKIRSAVKLCVGAVKRLEAVRVEAKEPFLSAGRIVDSHFNSMIDSVTAWKVAIEDIAHVFLKKREREERVRREAEAATAREVARVAAEAARKAEEDRMRAEQQGHEFTQAKLGAAFVGDEAPIAPDPPDVSAARQTERATSLDAFAKTNEAIKLSAAATAKPAELARVRSGSGVSTLAQIWKFEIEDVKKVDLEALREHLAQKDIEKAIGRFVALHKGDRTLPGVRIYSDTKPVMT